jgi:hypothetical protein
LGGGSIWTVFSPRSACPQYSDAYWLALALELQVAYF